MSACSMRGAGACGLGRRRMCGGADDPRIKRRGSIFSARKLAMLAVACAALAWSGSAQAQTHSPSTEQQESIARQLEEIRTLRESLARQLDQLDSRIGTLESQLGTQSAPSVAAHDPTAPIML